MDFNPLDEDELAKQTDEANSQKRNIGLAGALGDIWSNGQGFGNFYSGKMAPKITAAGDFASKAAAGIEDPAARQAKLYQAYKNSKEAKKLQDEETAQAGNKDPNSQTSKWKKAIAARYGIQASPEMSGYDIDQLIDAKKMQEVEAQSQVSFGNQKALQESSQKFQAGQNEKSRAAEMAKYAATLAAEQAKTKTAKVEKVAEEEKELDTTFGIARTIDDAKKLKDASVLKAKLDREIQELIDMRTAANGGSFSPEKTARAQQLSKSLLLTKKNLESLGVLSVSDMNIVNEIIPADPLEHNVSGLFGQDPTMVKLKKFKEDTGSDFQNNLKQRLRESPVVNQEDAIDPQVDAYAKKHGISYAEALAVKQRRMAPQTSAR